MSDSLFNEKKFGIRQADVIVMRKFELARPPAPVVVNGQTILYDASCIMNTNVVIWVICVAVAPPCFAQQQRPDRVSEVYRLRAILGGNEVKDFTCEITYTYNPGDRSGTKWKVVGTLRAKRLGSRATGDSGSETEKLTEHFFGTKLLLWKGEAAYYGVRFDGRVWPDVMYTEDNRNIPGWECTMISNEKNEVVTRCLLGDAPPTGQQPSAAALEVYFNQIQRLPPGDWVKSPTEGPVAFDYSSMNPSTYRPGVGGSQETARIIIRSISHARLDKGIFSLESMKNQVDWAMVIKSREWGKPWPALPKNPTEPASIPNACRRTEEWPPGRIVDVQLEDEVDSRHAFGRRDVHVWAANGLTDRLREIIVKSYGGNYAVWAQDGFGFTPLHYAAANGQVEVVRLLLSNPARGRTEDGDVLNDINHYSTDTMGPLHLAAIFGHTAVIDELLRAGVPLNGTDYRGNTALQYAAVGGQVRAIQSLLANGTNDDRIRTIVSALECAICTNQPASTLALCKDLDKKVQLGPLGTALHYAAQSGNLEVVQSLIKDAGYRPTCFNKDGQTPLFFAANGNVASLLIKEDPEIVGVLDRKRQSCAHSLAALNRPTALREVIEKCGGLARAADEKGRQPLVYAVYQGAVESAAILLDGGADPKVRVNDASGIAGLLGWGVTRLAGRKTSDWILSDDASLLHIAARNGDREMTKLLVSKGLDFDDQDGCQRTPLLVSIQHGQLDYAMWLLSDHNGLPQSPSASVSTSTGVEPIHLAAKVGDVKLIEALIKRGADVNARIASDANISAIADLASAIKSCHPGIMWGSTPLDIARAEEHWEVAEFLRRHGAKENDQ